MGDDYIIVGLGNPGVKYRGNRHNVGWMALDALADAWQLQDSVKKVNTKYEVSKGHIAGSQVYLLKPLTYMNLSGQAVQSALTKFKIPPSRLLVIYDDIALGVGKIRLRQQGSAGGHNGIKSIIAAVGTIFPRLRIGVGSQAEGVDLSDHVLSNFSDDEFIRVAETIDQVPAIANAFLQEPFPIVMNQFN